MQIFTILCDGRIKRKTLKFFRDLLRVFGGGTKD